MLGGPGMITPGTLLHTADPGMGKSGYITKNTCRQVSLATPEISLLFSQHSSLHLPQVTAAPTSQISGKLQFQPHRAIPWLNSYVFLLPSSL